jgi:glucose-1-phosphate cytidylyltransferase
MLTFSDGVGDVDIPPCWTFTKDERVATITGVRPVAPSASYSLGDLVQLSEKPQWRRVINGGFFVFSRRVFDYQAMALCWSGRS